MKFPTAQEFNEKMLGLLSSRTTTAEELLNMLDEYYFKINDKQNKRIEEADKLNRNFFQPKARYKVNQKKKNSRQLFNYYTRKFSNSW